MRFFRQQGRALLLAAVAVGAVCASDAAAQGTSGSGAFTDKRDGKTYKTVNIGDQTWMAQNLDYHTKSGSWCYDNNADSCKKYGRLYDWNTAMSACPNGWRLPSRKDWRELVTVAGSSTGATKLKTKSGWKDDGDGTDSYGFSAMSAGRRGSDGRFRNAGKYGYWWTATEFPIGGGNAFYRNMDYNYTNVYEDYRDKSNGCSVRCLSD
ncbi:hypothetical protein R80B4_02805 [Fibrobacteres bacterium R8-0-B4]